MFHTVKFDNKEYKTERLTLRRWKREDLEDFHEFSINPNVARAAGWREHRDIYESAEVLENFIMSKENLAIVFEGKAVGSISLERCEKTLFSEFNNKRSAKLGYSLSEKYWGRGIMTEAVREVCRILFEEKNADVIICATMPENTRSIAVQKKCGFVFLKKAEYENDFVKKVECEYRALTKEKYNDAYN